MLSPDKGCDQESNVRQTKHMELELNPGEKEREREGAKDIWGVRESGQSNWGIKGKNGGYFS